MKVARLLGVLLAALILIPMAHADGPVTMVFQNVNGANDGQYYVSPYTGTMDGQTVTLFCDDVLNVRELRPDVAGQCYESEHSHPEQRLFTNAIWRSSLFAGLRQCCSDLSGSRMAHHAIRIQFEQL
jgi:hypothetical protein